MTVALPIRQIAYFVPDIRSAAIHHYHNFGSGPFFVADNVRLRTCRYRGEDSVLDHSSAYGQWGDLMVEFVQQNNAGPSAFHDMYPAGGERFGMHHVAVFVDDIKTAIAGHKARGDACALYAEMESCFAFAMIDTVASLGHMVELYQPETLLLDFYAMVAKAAENFDGTDIVRPISFD
jgi:hypothetical protein